MFCLDWSSTNFTHILCKFSGPVNSPHKGQWREALMFSSICTRINDWVNNGEAGDLRRYRAHYDVTVMYCPGACECIMWLLFESLIQSAAVMTRSNLSWWRHQMETFSALLAICAGNSPVPGEFPTQRPVTRSFDVYFDLRPNKRLSKQSLGW